jgi:hypothetical protein
VENKEQSGERKKEEKSIHVAVEVAAAPIGLGDYSATRNQNFG